MLGNTPNTQTNQTCLVNPSDAQTLISLQMCGNGIVESGEDCDPGIGTNSTCCDTATCKFTSGSVCDPSNSECCTEQCSFAPSGQVCRPALDPQCDTAEVCTGTSAACPANKVSPDGEHVDPGFNSFCCLSGHYTGQKCGNGLACASGQCTSLDRKYIYRFTFTPR